jgi:hypothetical protein
MPADSQALLTTADLVGITLPSGSVVHRLEEGGLRPC